MIRFINIDIYMKNIYEKEKKLIASLEKLRNLNIVDIDKIEESKNLNLNLGRGGVPLSLDRTCDLRRIFAGAGRNRRYLRGSSNQKLEGKIEEL